jgi:hypothetical protein
VRPGARLHREGPGSISPSVDWLRERDFERLDLTVTDAQVTFTPSDELMAVLNSLD